MKAGRELLLVSYITLGRQRARLFAGSVAYFRARSNTNQLLLRLEQPCKIIAAASTVRPSTYKTLSSSLSNHE